MNRKEYTMTKEYERVCSSPTTATFLPLARYLPYTSASWPHTVTGKKSVTASSEIVRALRHTCDGCNPTPCCEFEALGPDAAVLIESLQAQLATEKRRADAAVEDLNLTANCDVCKHYDADEISCAKPTVDSYSCFEWRGPQEAGKGE
jgi:hypothetical protein